MTNSPGVFFSCKLFHFFTFRCISIWTEVKLWMRYWNALNCIKLELLDTMKKCIWSACIYCLRTVTSWQSNVTCLNARKFNWLLNHKDHQQVAYHQLIIKHEDCQQVLWWKWKPLPGRPRKPSIPVCATDVGVFFYRWQSAIADHWPVSQGDMSTGCKYVY